MLPKVVVLTSTFPRWPGDAQPRFVLELCQRLASDFSITVIAPHAEGAAEYERLEGIDVVRFRYAPSHRELLCYGSGMANNIRNHPWRILLLPGFLKAQAKALRNELLKTNGPSVVHAHWLFPQGFVAAHVLRKNNIPLMVTAHGSDVLVLKGWFWKWLHRRTLSRVQCVTTVGPEVRRQLQKLVVDVEKLHLLPLGVDTEYFIPSDKARDCFSLLYVGRLVPEKGVHILIQACSLLLNSFPEGRLIIAGDGVERDSLINLVEYLGVGQQVEFVGWLDKSSLLELYQTATLCIAPSFSEGFCLAVAEAMACGCPLIASDLPAFRYLDAGMDIITFSEAGKVKELELAITNLINMVDKRMEMATKGRKRILELSAQAQATTYASILKNI